MNKFIKNHKKLFLLLSIFLIIVIVGILLYFLFIKTNNSIEINKPIEITYISATEENYENAEKLDKSPLNINCQHSKYNNNGDNYEYSDAYCTLSITMDSPRISELWFEYNVNDYFDVIEAASLVDGNELGAAKDDNKMYLKFGNYDTKCYSGLNCYEFYLFQLKIKNFDEFNFNLSNILIKNSNGNYYKYENVDFKYFIVKDKTKYTYEEIIKDDSKLINFYLYNDDLEQYEKVNRYNCNNSSHICYVGGYLGAFYKDLKTGRTVLLDGDNIYLFDFNNGIITEFDSIKGSIVEENPYEPKYFHVTINNIDYIVDVNGNVVKSLEEYQFDTINGKLLISGVYSVPNNIMVLTKNNKKGIMEINNDKIIVDFEYDDIKLYDDKYFKAKKDDLWYIYDLSNDLPVTKLGYKELFILNNDLMIVQDDNYLYIKDFDGNNIIDDKIEVLYDYQEFSYEGEACGYRIYIDSKDSNIINISLTDKPSSDGTFNTYSYKYNIVEKKLMKVE